MSDGQKRQPMPGGRRKTATGYETLEFSRRRAKNRKRRELAKASRKKNR